MKRIQKYSGIFLAIYLAFVLLIVPQLNNPELMNSTQSSKAFGFIWGMLVYVPIALLIGIINSKSIILRITIIDILLGLYSIMVIISYWLHPVETLQMITFGALVLFYLSIRFLNPRYYLLLLMAVVVSGLIQAIYGNLQLYGVYPSNHGIFKMTGSFFNPGPYAGYLAAILPVSLGFYLYKDTIRVSDQHPFIRKWLSFYTILTNNINRIPFIFRTFYNKGIGRTTTEEQAKKLSHALNSAINLFVLISIVAMCLVLPASRSRAAWLAIMVSVGYLVTVRYNLLMYIKLTFNSVKKSITLIGSIVITLTIVGVVLYYFKKGSSDGRLLIWKISSNMIKDKPIWGHGVGNFAAEYMNYQAAYFKSNPNVSEAILAGDVSYAYNELLKITVELGIIGLLLVLVILGFLLYRKAYNKIKSSPLTAYGGLLSIFIFSIFSYPSDILSIKMLFVLFSTMVSFNQSPIEIFKSRNDGILKVLSKHTYFIKKSYLNIILIFAIALIYPASKCLKQQWQGYKLWKNAIDIYNLQAYNESLEKFVLAYPKLKTNGMFLMQYGRALELSDEYERSIEMLTNAEIYYNNSIIQESLGNNYKALKQYSNAEKSYLLAYYMTPAKFYPQYLLVKLYDDTGQEEKAIKVAKDLLSKKIKTKSTAINEIKKEMLQIINKHGSLIKSNIQN